MARILVAANQTAIGRSQATAVRPQYTVMFESLQGQDPGVISSLMSSTLWILLAFASLAMTACDADSRDGSGTPMCEDSCRFAADGECDDGGEGAMTASCSLGTDCTDCGRRPHVSDTPDVSDAGPHPRLPPTSDEMRTYPAICQRMPLSCPDAASLEACESSTPGHEACELLPLARGCNGPGCPSSSQRCRIDDDPAGYCTHPCDTDADCIGEDGDTVRCEAIGPSLSECVIDPGGARS